MDQREISEKILYILSFFAIVLFFIICKNLSSVMLPAISAILLGFVFKNIPERLEKKFKIPWVLSCVFILLFLIVIIFVFSSLLITSLTTIVAEFPKYENKFMTIFKIFADRFSIIIDEEQNLFQNLWQNLQIREYIQKIAIFLSSGVVSAGKAIFLVLILFGFLLIEIKSISNRFHTAFDKQDKTNVSTLSSKIINETSRYVFIKFIISLATGFLAFAGTKIIGMDFSIIWATFAFLMNFIPTFGSIFSCAITTLFALVQFYPDSIGKVIFIFIYMVAINFTLGNIIEPRIEGKELGLSPFVILVSLSLWGWAWGFVGMILAVPLTVILKIICENIDYLSKFALIFGYAKEKTPKKNNKSDK